MYLFEAIAELRKMGWTLARIGALGGVSRVHIHSLQNHNVTGTRNEELARGIERALKLKKGELAFRYTKDMSSKKTC